MSKRNRNAVPEEERKSAAEYYRLNLKAVDDLVNADSGNSPKVSEAELKKYRSGPRIHFSDRVKAVLLKAWFAGSVCFFFLWGLGTYIGNQQDQLFVLGLALGAVTDLLTNNIFRFYAKTPGANDRWMMFPRKKFITLPLNILYAYLLLFCVVLTYQLINMAIISFTGARDTVPLGVGPILFGAFTTAWDLLFLAMKRLAVRILADAKEKAGYGPKDAKHG
jgi:hypothetical protein